MILTKTSVPDGSNILAHRFGALVGWCRLKVKKKRPKVTAAVITPSAYNIHVSQAANTDATGTLLLGVLGGW